MKVPSVHVLDLIAIDPSRSGWEELVKAYNTILDGQVVNLAQLTKSDSAPENLERTVRPALPHTSLTRYLASGYYAKGSGLALVNQAACAAATHSVKARVRTGQTIQDIRNIHSTLDNEQGTISIAAHPDDDLVYLHKPLKELPIWDAAHLVI